MIASLAYASGYDCFHRLRVGLLLFPAYEVHFNDKIRRVEQDRAATGRDAAGRDAGRIAHGDDSYGDDRRRARYALSDGSNKF